MLAVDECETDGAYCTTASGLKFIDTEVGSGTEAAAGRVATIEFEGTLLDGTKVLSSTRKDGKPLSFTVAAGDAPLWDEVVACVDTTALSRGLRTVRTGHAYQLRASVQYRRACSCGRLLYVRRTRTSLGRTAVARVVAGTLTLTLTLSVRLAWW